MSQKYELFGKFILLDKVAAGGMAEVYRAKAPGAEGIGKILAIKRILPQYTSNSEFIEMFKTEAKIAINLTQANIAQIYEFGEDKSQFYLVMEYIDGRNLRQVLSRCSKLQKALTIEQCVFVIAQIANGLDYAHRCLDKNTGGPLNIIHRDMSPQNIMLSFEGEVKIVDFGIAKAESKIENTRAGTLKGKFGYMSPEQAEGLDLDSRTDIFSLGIVLWELLSGERLFIANNEVNTIRKIKECQIPALKKINPNIHEELDRISIKTLAKDRNLRYQTAAELHRDLSRFLHKVNPEFTQHELAISVKTLFKDEILEDRKKIVEFSKASFSPVSKEDKTHHTNTKTVTDQIDSETQSTVAPHKTDVPKNLFLDRNMNTNDVDFSSAVAGVDLARDVIEGQEANRNAGNYSQNYSVTGTPRRGRLSESSYETNPYAKENFFLKNMPYLLVLIVLGLGVRYFSSHPAAVKTVMGVVDKSFDKVQFQSKKFVASMNTDKIDQPSITTKTPLNTKPQTATGRLMVHSLPAGAQLEINGVPSGFTPVEVTVPLSQKITINFKRDGYITYAKDYIVTTNTDEVTATLQKAIVGYLNIDVRPSLADIYINGIKLAERAPIVKYAVPADKRIVVRAVNPLSNTADQQIVEVKQDTVKNLQLFLRKSN